MPTKRIRRLYTPDQKIALLRRHLLDKTSVSELCEEHGLQPSVFYSWQRHLFKHGAQMFQETRCKMTSKREQQLEQELKRLKARLAKKDAVIAAVTGEMVALKTASEES